MASYTLLHMLFLHNCEIIPDQSVDTILLFCSCIALPCLEIPFAIISDATMINLVHLYFWRYIFWADSSKWDWELKCECIFGLIRYIAIFLLKVCLYQFAFPCATGVTVSFPIASPTECVVILFIFVRLIDKKFYQIIFTIKLFLI